MTSKNIGQSFPSELTAAGAPTDGFSWTADGVITFIDSVTQAQKDAVNAVLAAHDPTKPAPPVVPDHVTRYQARAALLEAGLLGQVDAYFSGLPDDDMGKLAWNEAPTVRRDSEALVEAAHVLGLTDAQIDALFIRGNEFQ